MDMLEQANSIINKKSKKCKDLQKKLDALEQSFDELNATHERLEETHEKLGKAHSKLEKAHSLLLEQDTEMVIVSCDVGITCDLIDESFMNQLLLLPLILHVAHHPLTPPFLPLLLVMVSLVMPH
jgi:predicted nuclease with TOPRIM domain